ncbi:MAG: peptidylprolyl isomerase [Acidobacteria bacterium]|nr:peptidylprolyl isomerase [Acidobacteriota bacterium]
MKTQIEIAKAEDARRYDSVLEGLMKSPSADIRKRAALAAGRVGDEKAIPALTELLDNDPSVRSIAAFALGEVESIKAAEAILGGLRAEVAPSPDIEATTARLVEAAGKVAAANSKDPKSKELAQAILDVLNAEFRRTKPYTPTIVLGLTAALRARPDGADRVAAQFLNDRDAGVRAAALNTLARLRAKNVKEAVKLLTDADPIVRANAARVTANIEGDEAANALVDRVRSDKDSRVRVAAIRSLAGVKKPAYAGMLLDELDPLFKAYKASKFAHPVETNEILEFATAVGRILQGTNNERALTLLKTFAAASKYRYPETEIAIARIDPAGYTAYSKNKGTDAKSGKWAVSAAAQAASVIAGLDDSPANKEIKKGWSDELRKFLDIDPTTPSLLPGVALPDVLGAYADFKTADLGSVARKNLLRDDVFVRASAAGVLGGLPPSDDNVEALKSAFSAAFIKDKVYDDALLSIMGALHKVDKRGSVGSLLTALDHPDYLVRKQALELLDDPELKKDLPGLAASLENARSKHKDQVLPYSPAFGTLLGQVLNSDADYLRALSRKNGAVRALVTTDKGSFTIEFAPEQAPLTVDNYIKLARKKYFDGVTIHRVVPNFVVQDGDPRGDGNGGPGYSIRCEINMLPFDRGAVGMALSGKDTGGSQWFVDHSPQLHLDGGYTVFGHIDEEGMKIVDQLVRGDRILSVKIIGK